MIINLFLDVLHWFLLFFFFIDFFVQIGLHTNLNYDSKHIVLLFFWWLTMYPVFDYDF